MHDRLPRKLSVILHADVVGYSRLAGADEDDTHRRLKNSFAEAHDVVSTYHGRIVNTAGDAFLAVFEAAVDAVSCAVSIQQIYARQNEDIEDARKIQFRIGINLGDIIEDDGNVFGDGVNIAARLESLAEPGGICISESVYSVVGGKLPLQYRDIGLQTVKNIKDPIRSFSISNLTDVNLPRPTKRANSRIEPATSKTRSIIFLSIIFILTLAIVAGSISWFGQGKPEVEATLETNMAYPLPSKPSIAVLPFTNMSEKQDQEYFSDGITEDLITDLSKISELFVIARNTAFTYKNKTVNVKQVSEDLGIRYVLEGSVRRSGDQVRINAQLVDATTGGHLWADRYDGMAKDIFALQDRVTEQIVNALSVKLIDDSDSESDREKFGTQNTDAHDAYLQGLSFYLRNTPADNARSESFFLRAVELDPDFKRAYAALAKVYYKASSKEYALALGMYSRKAIFLAHINLIKTEGADMADVHVVRSQMALDKHQVGIALTEAASALKLNPNHIDALKAKSKALIYLGQYPEGREIAESIIRLDPAAPAEPLFLIGLSEFALGRYAPASEYIERAIKSDPTTATYFGVLAASLGKSGQTEKAGSAWDSYREFWNRIERPIWIAAAVYPHPFEQREVLQNLAEGLRNAGAAERPPSLYLKLDKDNRLEGTEIRALLFGKTIRGEDYWRKTLWSQIRSLEGEVIHTGEPIHIVGYQYDHDEKTAKSWIDDNRLCMQWAVQSTPLTICEQVYHDSDSDRETYYLVTDMGPHPFHIVE